MDTREALSLLRQYHEQGDGRARETLIEGFAPMVRRLAQRFAGRGEPLDDLFQVGMVGLIKAVDRFDLDRGVAFPTYAVPCVIGEIKRHFRDRLWSVRVPRGLKDLGSRTFAEQERLTGLLGRRPTIRELAQALGVDEEEVVEAVEAWRAHTATSLSSTASESDEESDMFEQLGKEDEGYRRCEDRLALRAGIVHLDDRERQVLRLHFNRGLTQSQIAVRLGYSQMHISRILRGALNKLGEALVDTPAAA